EILAAMNGEVYFFCSHFENSSSSIPQYYSLWKSNGTAAGTVVLYYFNGRDFFPSPGMEPLVANGYLYFLRRTFDSGLELWRTDGSPEGTPGGTIMLTDIGPGPEDTVIQYLTRL